jgi:hypothetical protein
MYSCKLEWVLPFALTVSSIYACDSAPPGSSSCTGRCLETNGGSSTGVHASNGGSTGSQSEVGNSTGGTAPSIKNSVVTQTIGGQTLGASSTLISAGGVTASRTTGGQPNGPSDAGTLGEAACVGGMDAYCSCLTQSTGDPCTPDLIVTMQMACAGNQAIAGRSLRKILQCHLDNVAPSGLVDCTSAGACMLDIPTTCEGCLSAYCNREIDNCSNDTNCLAIVDCLTPCIDVTCQERCILDYPDGILSFSDLTKCASDQCPVCGSSATN